MAVAVITIFTVLLADSVVFVATVVLALAVGLRSLRLGDPFTGERKGGGRYPYWQVACEVALVVVIVAMLTETQRPLRLEPTTVHVHGGTTLEGSFIAHNGQAIYIGQAGAIVGIPNDRVADYRIRPAPQPHRGRSLADRLLDRLGLD